LPKSHFSPFFTDSGSGAALVPASPDPLAAGELLDKTTGGAKELGHAAGLAGGAEELGNATSSTGGAGELGHATGSAGTDGELGHATALNLLPAMGDRAEPVVEETTLLVQSHVLPTPTAAPDADAKQTFPVKKKPPTLKHVNTARKHPRPKPTLPGPPRGASPASPLGFGLPTASQQPRARAEAAAGVGDTERSPPELPWGGQPTTSHPALQISPSTLPPPVPRSFPAGAGDAGEAPTASPAGTAIHWTNGVESEVHGSASEESQETTTSTIVTTTVTTTEPTPGKPGRGVAAADGEQLRAWCRRQRLRFWGCLKPPALRWHRLLEHRPGAGFWGRGSGGCGRELAGEPFPGGSR